MNVSTSTRRDFRKHIYRYYMKGALLPLVVVIIGYTVFGIADVLFGESEPYVSEWFTDDDFFILGYFVVMLNGLIVCILSAPLLLNVHAGVRTNPLLSGLAYLLLPLGWIGIIIGNSAETLMKGVETWEMGLFVLGNTFPYLAGLLITFVQFRRDFRQVPLLR